jgi:hypothetical protein
MKKMMKDNPFSKFQGAEFFVEGIGGLSMSQALRCWKTLFEGDFIRFKARLFTNPSMEEFVAFVEEMWESIIPLTASDAFAVQNQEQRRVMFQCLGVEKLFKELEPTLLDRQVLKMSNLRWDNHNQPYQQELEDVYELYEIDGQKLFGDVKRSQFILMDRETVYAVRCWCTTTGREYWLYVPREIGAKKDAVEAIAWTIQLNITYPKRLYRQGDIIIAEEGPDSKPCQPYHLDKETYIRLLVSQT